MRRRGGGERPRGVLCREGGEGPRGCGVEEEEDHVVEGGKRRAEDRQGGGKEECGPRSTERGRRATRRRGRGPFHRERKRIEEEVRNEQPRRQDGEEEGRVRNEGRRKKRRSAGRRRLVRKVVSGVERRREENVSGAESEKRGEVDENVRATESVWEERRLGCPCSQEEEDERGQPGRVVGEKMKKTRRRSVDERWQQKCDTEEKRGGDSTSAPSIRR
eukprot:3937682-Rhodomonas_salina.1